MKYLISYQCNDNGKAFESQFEFEADQQPNLLDANLINAALKHSARFAHSGMFGLVITKIELISPQIQPRS